MFIQTVAGEKPICHPTGSPRSNERIWQAKNNSDDAKLQGLNGNLNKVWSGVDVTYFAAARCKLESKLYRKSSASSSSSDCLREPGIEWDGRFEEDDVSGREYLNGGEVS